MIGVAIDAVGEAILAVPRKILQDRLGSRMIGLANCTGDEAIVAVARATMPVALAMVRVASAILSNVRAKHAGGRVVQQDARANHADSLDIPASRSARAQGDGDEGAR